MLFENRQAGQPMLDLEQLHCHLQSIDFSDLIFELHVQSGDSVLSCRQVLIGLFELGFQIIQRDLLFLKLLLRLVVQIVRLVAGVTSAADQNEQ